MKNGYHTGKLVFGKNETLGKRIAKARRWYGMSNAELAYMAQVSVSTINNIQGGEDFLLSTLLLIAQGMDIPPERFLSNLPELRR